MHTALAVPADAEAVRCRLSQEGYLRVTACYHPSGGFYSVQHSAEALMQDELLSPQAPSPYIPISAHTQQLTPLRLLQIMDALHASSPCNAAASAHPTPTQQVSCQQHNSTQACSTTGQHMGCTPAQPVSVQHAAAGVQESQHRPMPAHGNDPALPHSTCGTATTQAGASSSSGRGPVMINLALVDRRDVVVLPAYDGLQPPAEGQQRH